MDQKNILPRGIAKPIEQQPDGTWIVRHHFRVVGTSENGEELVTFASSEYPDANQAFQLLTQEVYVFANEFAGGSGGRPVRTSSAARNTSGRPAPRQGTGGGRSASGRNSQIGRAHV